MNHFSRENMGQFYRVWDSLKIELVKQYESRDASVEESLKKALHNYYKLLEYGEVNNTSPSALLPLNGEERLAFIEEQFPRKYAFIQLDALYDESRKKAARLSVTGLK